MAKANKSTASDGKPKPERTPPKKAESKKTEPKASAAPAAPAINPAQAAGAAAALVGNKVQLPATGGQETAQTASFKALKNSLNKPHSQTIGGILDKFSPAGQKKSATPFGFNKQVGHSQTFGADVSRKNVPRRTGG